MYAKLMKICGKVAYIENQCKLFIRHQFFFEIAFIFSLVLFLEWYFFKNSTNRLRNEEIRIACEIADAV